MNSHELSLIIKNLRKIALNIDCTTAVERLANIELGDDETDITERAKEIKAALQEMLETLKNKVIDENPFKNIPGEQLDLIFKIDDIINNINQSLDKKENIDLSSIQDYVLELNKNVTDLKESLELEKKKREAGTSQKDTGKTSGSTPLGSASNNSKRSSSNIPKVNPDSSKNNKEMIIRFAVGAAVVTVIGTCSYLLVKNICKLVENPNPKHSDSIGPESDKPEITRTPIIESIESMISYEPVILPSVNIKPSEPVIKPSDKPSTKPSDKPSAPVNTDPINSIAPTPTVTPSEKPVETPKPTDKPVIESPVPSKEPSDPIQSEKPQDTTKEELKSAASIVYKNWSALGINLTQDQIEEIIKALNGMDSTYSLEEVDQILLNVLNAAVVPGVNNVLAGENNPTKELDFASLILGEKKGLRAVEKMEDYLNGCLTDSAHLYDYCESAFLEEAQLLGENDTIYGFNVIDTSIDPAVRYVWAKLTLGVNVFCGTFGDNLYIELNNEIYTQSDLNDGEAINQIANSAKKEMGSKTKSITLN